MELMDSSSNLVWCSTLTLDVSLLMIDFTSMILFTELSPLQFQAIIFINHLFGFPYPLLRPKLFHFLGPPPFFSCIYCNGIVCILLMLCSCLFYFLVAYSILMTNLTCFHYMYTLFDVFEHYAILCLCKQSEILDVVKSP